MTSAPVFSDYEFENQNELCLKTGAQHKLQVLFIPPLFDEHNRMRRLLVDAMRILDQNDIGCTLPDLPGTNESLASFKDCNLETWRQAILSCFLTSGKYDCIAPFRGGALLDIVDCEKHWCLAPVEGKRLLRAMMRTRVASDAEDGLSTKSADIEVRAKRETVNLAGYDISPTMFTQLQQADAHSHENTRVCRLAGDTKAADVYINGSAIWLRAEPEADPVLSKSIAEDIAAWIAK